MPMDNFQIAMVTAWLICAAGLIILQGKRGLIGVGVMLAIIMALGIFPSRPPPVFTGADEKGEPMSDADRARAVEVPSGLDDDIPRQPRVLARGTIKVRLPDGRIVTARTRKIQVQ
jgi:hypothetical protein